MQEIGKQEISKVEIYLGRLDHQLYRKPRKEKYEIKLQCSINLPEGVYIRDVKKSEKIKVSFSERNLKISEITWEEFQKMEQSVFFVTLPGENVKEENIILQEEIIAEKRGRAQKIFLEVMRKISEKEIELLKDLRVLVEIHTFESIIYEGGEESFHFFGASLEELLEKMKKELSEKILSSEFERIERELKRKLEVKSQKPRRRKRNRKITFKYFPASELDKITGIFKLGGNALEDEKKLYE